MADQSVSVKCPECSHEFPLGEAVLGSLRSEVTTELQEKMEQRETLLAEKLRRADEQQAALKKQEAQLQEKIEELLETRLRTEREEIRQRAERKAAADQEITMGALREENAAKTAALKKAQADEVELRRQKQQIEEARDSLQLEMQRKLDAERAQIRESARAQANEENRLRIAEKDQLVQDLVRQLEDAQRRAEQGSQQRQGEILEVDFEAQLRRAFIHDHVSAVAKGVAGADLMHEVRNQSGKRCGLILYENKRTKNWSDGWVAKLKEDMRHANADMGVIVTEVMPPDSECFCQRDQVWVTDLKAAIPLAHVLRCHLQDVHLARAYREGAKEKMELLYSYLTGNEFTHRVRAVIEAFDAMHKDLQRERKSMTRLWSKREKHINSVVENMAGMIGDVQAISGNALQEMPSLDLDDADSDTDEDPLELEAPGTVR